MTSARCTSGVQGRVGLNVLGGAVQGLPLAGSEEARRGMNSPPRHCYGFGRHTIVITCSRVSDSTRSEDERLRKLPYVWRDTDGVACEKAS